MLVSPQRLSRAAKSCQVPGEGENSGLQLGVPKDVMDLKRGSMCELSLRLALGHAV